MAAFEDALTYHPFGGRLLHLQTPHLTGTDVKVFQVLFNTFLAHASPPSGPIGTPVLTDGIFGPASADAATAWQRYFGLAVDGVLGPETYFSLGQGVGSRTTYGGPPFGSRSLRQGESGGDVEVAQNRLNTYRYWIYLGAPADGSYGARTTQAVRHLQSDLASAQPPDTGLPADGAIGPETFDGFWAYTFLGGRDLFTGRDGLDTLFVQSFLHDERPQFYTGALDGLFGPRTRAAVEGFQRYVKIGVDGVVGPVTTYQIGRQFDQPAGVWP